MAGALLEVTGLSKRFGGFVALDGIDLSVAAGERVGLIGPTAPENRPWSIAFAARW
jgi:ABC-type branched-subunit amino acid transport system ATPase component